MIFWLLIKPAFLKKNWPVIFFMLFFIFGIWRYQASFDQINKNHISFYNNQKLVFQGKVIKEPDQRIDKIKLTIGNITTNNQALSGKVLVNVPLYSDYQYNDLLEIECKLKKPGIINPSPSKLGKGFDYHEYLARYDIYSFCSWSKIKVLKPAKPTTYSKILWFKNKTRDLINANFTEPQGAFISALLLGLKRQVPQEVRDWFARSGTAHVLAVSGLHISVLCQLIMIFFTSVLLIRRQKAFYPTVLLIILFVILAGAPASAIRAAIMGLALIAGEKIGRPQSGSRLIVLTATIMLLINPKLLKADIGFQLSFVAVLGLSFFTQPFSQFFKKVPNFNFFPLRQYLAASLSAQIFVLPLVLYYFGNLSLIAPLANVLTLVMMPIIMTLGLCFALAGLIHIYLAKIIFYPLWLLLTYVILIAKIGSSIPYLSFVISNFSFIFVIILYIFIILWLSRIQRHEKRTT